MEHHTSRKGYMYAGCISLAAHLLILVFFYSDIQLFLTHQKDTVIPEPQSEVIPPPSHWAKREPGASQFGAPVILADFERDHPTPEPLQEQTPVTTKKTTELPDIFKDGAAQRDHGIIVSEQTKKEIQQQQREKEETQEQKTVTDTHKTLAQQKPSPAQEEQKDPKRTITFAELARGFLERAGSGKDGGMQCNGTGKVPPEEQIKYERYAQRVHWCIQNMFRIYKRQLSLSRAVRSILQVKIERDDDGNVTSMYLLKSSGSVELDQFMVKVFKDASKSFPPFPKFLDKNLFSNVFTLNIDVPATTGANMIMSM